MKEIILDTNIFYKYLSMYKGRCNILIASFYNFQDLLASKSNLKNINSRLSGTLKSKLELISNHEVLIFEPHYYILKDIFPNSKYAKPLFDRIDETNPNSFLSKLNEVLDHGSSIRPSLKSAIISYAKQNNIKKRKNNKDAQNFANKTFKLLKYKSIDQVNYRDFIPCVTKLLIDQLNTYRTKNMLRTQNVTTANFNHKKYELFLTVYSRYLATLVGPEQESPSLNDNIDSQILLYVHKGRKLMSCENKWIDMIKDVGLHKKYVQPYSDSFANSISNCIKLNLLNDVRANNCK